MQLQVIPSHFAKSCCGKWYKRNNVIKMTEVVKIVNDSRTCLANRIIKGGKECRFIK